MSVQGFVARANSSGEDRAIINLPEGVYQCAIDKLEMREGTKYMSEEKEMQILFYLKPLNVGKEFENKILFYQTSTSFFNGKSKNAQSQVKASKLFGVFKTVYKFYKPDVKVEDMQPEQITDATLNDLEGKQIVAIVKMSDSGKNKVTDIMSITAPIQTGTTPDQDLEKVLNS